MYSLSEYKHWCIVSGSVGECNFSELGDNGGLVSGFVSRCRSVGQLVGW